MKKILYSTIGLFTLLLSSTGVFAQCSGGVLAGTISPTAVYQPQLTGNGQYYTFNAVSGGQYYFSFCGADGGSATWDTQITILDNTGAYAGGYNDDFCGLQSYVTWTAPTSAVYRVLISQYFCTTSVNTGTFVYKVVLPTPMAYVSSTTTQSNTQPVATATTNNQIIGVQIVTSGASSPFNLTSMTLNSNGTTNFATDVTNVRVWYTGTSATFATTTQFGPTVTSLASPITGSQVLANGTNYFWVTYDISGTATLGDFVDAECTQLVMSGVGGTRVPSTTAPAGNRLISYCVPSYSFACSSGDYIDNFSTTLGLTNITNNASGCNGQPNNYIYYSSMNVSAQPGNTINVSMQAGSSWPQGFRIWVDWNNNGSFADPGDDVYNSGTSGNGPFTGTITVPLATTAGTKRMRVRCSYASVPTTTDYCSTLSFGETEDYNFVVVPLSPIDMSVTAMTSPVSSTGCFTSTESVIVTIKNFGSALIDFSTNPCTVSANVTGPNPFTFTPVVLNSGTLAPNATQNVTVTTTYNMLTQGTYVFNAATSVSGDGNASNDAMAPVSVVSNVPTAVASNDTTICNGDSAQLNVNATAFGFAAPITLFNTTDFVVPDGTGVPIMSPITVGPTSLMASQILSATVDSLPHTWDSDLYIQLQAPDGSIIDLSAFNGGSGDNFYGTVFSNTGPAIGTGTPPFTGTYQPDQPFSLLTGSASGTWNMVVSDWAGGDQGTLQRWTLRLSAPNTIATYNWAPATGLSSTSVANPMAAPSATTTYTVTVTDGNGCTRTDMVTVNVNPSPIENLGADVIQCGGTVVLDAQNPGSSYLWNDASTNQTLTASTTGNYYVTVTNGSGCSKTDSVSITINPVPVVALGADQTVCDSLVLNAQNPGDSYMWNTAATTQTLTVINTGSYYVVVTDPSGCTNSDTISVTINPSPVVTLGSDTAFCQGNSTVLDAGNPGSTYLWSDASTSQTLTVTTAGTYYVTVTNGFGCSKSDTIAITVNALPVVALGNDTTLCGGPLLLDAGNPGSAYVWNNASTAQTLSASATGNYSVVVTDGNGCSNSDAINVTINPYPVAPLGSDSAVCGTSYVLDAGNPGSMYLWSTSATTQTITISSSGTYFVTVTTTAGCSISDTVAIVLNTPPTANAGPDTSICVGNTVTLNGNNGFSGYLWEFDSFQSNTQSITVTPGVTTTYTLTVTDANGCTGSDMVVVTVDQAPVASFTYVITGGNNVTFTNTSTGSSPLTFTWDFGDGSPTSTLANPTHTYTANGTYNVLLVATNACGSFTFSQTITVTGIGFEELSADGTIKVFPNPSNGLFTISVDIDLDQLQVDIYDLQGKQVYGSMDEHVISGFNRQVDLQGLADGMYTIRINTGNVLKTGKLIISK
jgi:hypothetical protein